MSAERVRPLRLIMESCVSREVMNEQVLETIKRGYTRINEYLGQFEGRVAICGSGPSLEKYWQEIDTDILAVNSAIKFLIEHGRPPRFAMIWDADPLCEHFAVPHPDVTYLVAARCHRKVFERLKDCRVIVWYAGGDHNIADVMREHQLAEPTINGGSAGVTRALFLAVALGYTDITAYGADSSYSGPERSHVQGSLVAEKPGLVEVAGKHFLTTPELCAQVDEYRNIVMRLKGWVEIRARGDGLLPYIDWCMREHGDNCSWEPLSV